MQAFAAALAIGGLALLPYCRVIAIVTAVIVIASSFAGLQTDHLILCDEDITSESLAAYEWFTGNIGSTVSAEYLSDTVQPRFYTSAWLSDGLRREPRAQDGELVSVELLEASTGRQRWAVQAADNGANVLFPTMAWPGWQASIDGQEVELRAAPGSGHIMVSLPPGEHALTLRLARTNVRLAAELISFCSLLLLVFLLLKAGRPRRIDRPAMAIGIAFLGFLLIFRFWPEDKPSARTLTWDFAQMAYLHHDKAGVPFSSGTSLMSYTYDREIVAAGEDLIVTMEFSEANDDLISLALGSPALTGQLTQKHHRNK